ncbi:hypothetical protein AAVH_11111 [Aphelenchoides avenae]|nr:hypothetical protein AAVH_11111 [Aphelenchus avenae]
MPGFFDSVLYPREFIALPLEFALLSFHISVTVLIAIKMRQGILLVNRWSEVIDAFTTNAVLRYSFNVLYQFSAYFEVAAYVPIAFNRWTAIVHPMAHQRIRHASLSITNFAVTAVNITLEAWSFLAYRRMDFAGKKHNHENFRLLFTYHHISPQDFAFLDEDYTFDASINYLFSFQALCGPMFLFAMSSSLRQDYKSFYRPGRRARITQVTPPSTISLAEWH